MTHPAEYNTTECETVCVKCGDASKTLVDNEILTEIPRGVKREVEKVFSLRCAVCRNQRFLLIVPPTEDNILDEMYQET